MSFVLALLSLGILSVAMVAVVACGKSGGEASPSPTASASAVAGASGTITVSTSTIVGQSGRVLLIFAASEGGGPVARACIPIASDRFAAPPTVMTNMPAAQNPCGDPTPQTTFREGSYTVTAGIYVPGSQAAQVQTSQTAKVSASAPAEVKLDGAALSR